MIPIVLTNLRRRPSRTLFTASGIAVGVATIVALLSFTAGLKRTAGGLVHLGGAGLGVFQANVSDPTASLLPTSLAGRLASRPYVSEATPLMLIVEAVKAEPAAIVFGAAPDGFFGRGLVFESGRPAQAAGEVSVGDKLATELHVVPGRSLALSGHLYRIAGIYHSGIYFEDAGAVLPLASAQALTNRPGEATDVVVQLSPRTKAADAEHAIQHDFPGTQVLSDPDQALRAGANGTLISKATFLIVVVALILGGLSVVNTISMAVIERQREFGLLSAIGWSPERIAALVLGEGVAVSLMGAAVGVILGVLGGRLLVGALGVSTYVSPEVTAWGIGRGLLIGIAIGVLGGLQPAWRVARRPPLRALSRA